MSLKKNLFYNVILSVSNVLLPAITFPYVSRILGPQGIGVTNLAQSFFQYFISFAALGIPVYGIRAIAQSRDDKNSITNIFWELNTIRILCSILLLIPYSLLIFTISKLHPEIELYLWGGFLLLTSVTSLEWFFAGLEDFKYITLRSLFVRLLALAALFIFVKQRSDVLPYFMLTVGTMIINGLINVRYALSSINPGLPSFHNLKLKRHLKPLFIIFWGIFAITVYVVLDTVILGLLSTDKSVGLYTSSTKISKLSITIITAVGVVLVPRLSYAVSSNNKPEIDRLLNHSFDFVITLGVPIAFGTFFLATELTRAFSGDEFLESVTSLQIMSPMVLIIGLANLFSVQILTPLSKDKFVMYASFIGAAVSIALNVLLIPRFSENGAATSYLLAELIVAVIAYMYVQRFIKYKPNWNSFFIASLLSLLFLPIYLLAKLIFKDQYLLVLIFTISISAVIYTSIQYFILKNKVVSEILGTVKGMFIF